MTVCVDLGKSCWTKYVSETLRDITCDPEYVYCSVSLSVFEVMVSFVVCLHY